MKEKAVIPQAPPETKPHGAMFDLTKITLNPDNPRTISESAFKKLVKSIQEFPRMMELRPMVIDETGMLLGGNQRYRAITQGLGMTECPASWVVKAGDLTGDQRKRFIIADNAPDGMQGDWNFDLLANKFELPDLISFGFEEKELFGEFNTTRIPTTNTELNEASLAETNTECPKCGFAWKK